MKKIVFIKREKNGIHSQLKKYSARNPGFLLIITGWGESGKVHVILQLNMGVFWALSKNVSAPYKNWPVRLWGGNKMPCLMKCIRQRQKRCKKSKIGGISGVATLHIMSWE